MDGKISRWQRAHNPKGVTGIGLGRFTPLTLNAKPLPEHGSHHVYTRVPLSPRDTP